MKLATKAIVAILALIGVLVIALNIVGPGAVLSQISDCSAIVLRESQSPSGELTASIRSSTCEDPELSGTSVFIRRTGERNANGTRIADNTTTEFELSWITDRELEIAGPASSLESSIPDEIAGVQIRLRRSR